MMQTGKVLRFDDVRGYGFIAPDGGGEDVFVHANELLGDKIAFCAGTFVEFEVAQGDRGLKALAVRLKEPVAGPPLTVTCAVADGGAGQEGGLRDVLGQGEFLREMGEFLLAEAPDLTAAQIVRLRGALLAFARRYGWVEA